MKNENFSLSVEHLRDPDKKMTSDFKKFIDDNGFTSEQMQMALERFYDDNSENQEKNPAVEKILEKINEMVDNNFPLNRLSELVGAKKEFEMVVPKYFDYVETLDISEKEKKVLRSIVENKRKGELEFFLGKRAVVNITIRQADEPDILAMELMRSIKKLVKAGTSNGGKYGFSFSEE